MRKGYGRCGGAETVSRNGVWCAREVPRAVNHLHPPPEERSKEVDGEEGHRMCDFRWSGLHRKRGELSHPNEGLPRLCGRQGIIEGRHLLAELHLGGLAVVAHKAADQVHARPVMVE